MATTKKEVKKAITPKKLADKEMKDVTLVKIKEGFSELEKMIKQSKAKFDEADDGTKKKVLAGIAGAAAILGGLIGAGAAIRKHQSKK